MRRRVWHVVESERESFEDGEKLTAMCGHVYRHKNNDPKYACATCLKLTIDKSNNRIEALEGVIEGMAFRMSVIRDMATPEVRIRGDA